MLKDKKRIEKIKNRGFTLVESMVAISILTISILATFTAVQSGLKQSLIAKDQMTAFYLAQESIEFIKNMRDENALNNLHCTSTGSCPSVSWLHGISEVNTDPCWFGKTCTIDSPAKILTQCPAGSCPNLNHNPGSGLYGYTIDVDWVTSNFNRSLQFTSISAKEVLVTITMSWNSGGFTKSFQVSESIFDRQ